MESALSLKTIKQAHTLMPCSVLAGKGVYVKDVTYLFILRYEAMSWVVDNL